MLGKRVFIKGNVDPVRTVLLGTPEEVRQAALERLRREEPTVLSTACSVPPAAPPENIVALGEAAHTFSGGAA